jgi:hypothetical protein
MGKKEHQVMRELSKGPLLECIDGDEPAMLCCPACESAHNHVHTATLVSAEEDAKTGYAVRLDYRGNITTDNKAEPIGRRQRGEPAVKIVFECEQCLARWALTIHHHKGSQYIGCEEVF